MNKDFCKTIKFVKIKNGQFSFFNILQLPHTVISYSEKLTHPIGQCVRSQAFFWSASGYLNNTVQ